MTEPCHESDGGCDCRLRTPEEARGFVAAFVRAGEAEEARAHAAAPFLDADELSVHFVEEVGRAAADGEFAAVRDLLCRRKLGIGYETLTGLFAGATREAFAWLRGPFADGLGEGIRPRMLERIGECETQFALAFRDHRPALDEEIRDSATIDPYQLVLVYLDHVWRTLPVGETPETDAFVARDLVADYEQAVEQMYTLLAGKLMTGLLGCYERAAGPR